MIHLYQTHPAPSTSFSVWACMATVSMLESEQLPFMPQD